MRLVTTIKIKIKHNKELLDMREQFTKAIRYAIDKGFEAKISNRFELQQFVYYDIRKRFGLLADFTIKAIGKASENLKSAKLKVKPFMRKTTIVWDRKLSTFGFDKVRIATLTPKSRIDIPIEIPEYYWKYLDWRYQTLELVTDKKGRMFFHIRFSREVDAPSSCGNKLLGVDLGVNNLAVCSDGKVFKGHKTRIIQYQYLRKKLQRKGTKSAKRLLKKLSGRQKRYVRWINHNVSKQIVESADVIILEDLKGILRIRNKYMGKRLNRWLNSWSFCQLQSFIKYKAERQGKKVVFVKPFMTSKICSNCGERGSRYFDNFFCSHCGFSSQSDFNAACNLRRHPVTVPNIPNDEGKGQLTTELEFRDKNLLT